MTHCPRKLPSYTDALNQAWEGIPFQPGGNNIKDTYIHTQTAHPPAISTSGCENDFITMQAHRAPPILGRIVLFLSFTMLTTTHLPVNARTTQRVAPARWTDDTSVAEASHRCDKSGGKGRNATYHVSTAMASSSPSCSRVSSSTRAYCTVSRCNSLNLPVDTRQLAGWVKSCRRLRYEKVRRK